MTGGGEPARPARRPPGRSAAVRRPPPAAARSADRCRTRGADAGGRSTLPASPIRAGRVRRRRDGDAARRAGHDGPVYRRARPRSAPIAARCTCAGRTGTAPPRTTIGPCPPPAAPPLGHPSDAGRRTKRRPAGWSSGPRTAPPSGALIGRLDRRGRLRWSLPKGHVEHGETHEQAAIREVEEETGISGRITARLGSVEYTFVAQGRRIHKRVHHYLMEAVGGELSDADIEVTEVAWVPLTDLAGPAGLRRGAAAGPQGRRTARGHRVSRRRRWSTERRRDVDRRISRLSRLGRRRCWCCWRGGGVGAASAAPASAAGGRPR